MNTRLSEYSRTFTSFSGADIVATFGQHVIGTLQSITYSVTREKSPIYVMGSANPRSFSRGKRGIAGSLVFTVFDRDSFANLKENTQVYRHNLNDTEGLRPQPAHAYDNITDGSIRNQAGRPKYSDEIPPFDVTINFLNEYGNEAVMTIYGVEILNEGIGMSIDDITTEKACTFIARDIESMKATDGPASW